MFVDASNAARRCCYDSRFLLSCQPHSLHVSPLCLSLSAAPQAKHQLDEEFVYVDAHILCTPAIADIDNDQHDELVVAVSYFYDKEYYDDPAHAHELTGIDKEKYVAGARLASRMAGWLGGGCGVGRCGAGWRFAGVLGGCSMPCPAWRALRSWRRQGQLRARCAAGELDGWVGGCWAACRDGGCAAGLQ